MTYWTSIFWFLASLSISGFAGYSAYTNVAQFSSAVDLLATIISILIGVSLALIAVLNAPVFIAKQNAKDKDELARQAGVVGQDDEMHVSTQ